MTIEPLLPDPHDPRLSRSVEGVDETGQPKSLSVIEERPLTIYLNSQEIVTAMTIGDHPEYLALGFLLNQGMLKATDQVTGIRSEEHTSELQSRPHLVCRLLLEKKKKKKEKAYKEN